jgi:hypothetical protein
LTDATFGVYAAGDPRRTSVIWKVSETMSMRLDDGFGYGFNVTNERGRPVVSFAYRTQQEAGAAATHVRSAVENAASVKGYSELAL